MILTLVKSKMRIIFNSEIEKFAEDSINIDISNKKVHLHGKCKN